MLWIRHRGIYSKNRSQCAHIFRDMMMVECPGLREKLNALQEQDESTGNENSTNTPPQTPRGGDPQRPQELALEGMEYENVKEMLKCLYPPRKPVTGELELSCILFLLQPHRGYSHARRIECAKTLNKSTPFKLSKTD